MHHSFNKYLLTIYYVLATILDAWDTSVNKNTAKSLPFHSGTPDF